MPLQGDLSSRLYGRRNEDFLLGGDEEAMFAAVVANEIDRVADLACRLGSRGVGLSQLRNRSGKSILHVAVENSSLAMVKLLATLSPGLLVERETDNFRTVLHFAVSAIERDPPPSESAAVLHYICRLAPELAYWPDFGNKLPIDYASPILAAHLGSVMRTHAEAIESRRFRNVTFSRD